jgi:hypothetical protein
VSFAFPSCLRRGDCGAVGVVGAKVARVASSELSTQHSELYRSSLSPAALMTFDQRSDSPRKYALSPAGVVC